MMPPKTMRFCDAGESKFTASSRLMPPHPKQLPVKQLVKRRCPRCSRLCFHGSLMSCADSDGRNRSVAVCLCTDKLYLTLMPYDIYLSINVKFWHMQWTKRTAFTFSSDREAKVWVKGR